MFLGVLLMFALSFVLVASNVPGMGRSSLSEEQAVRLKIIPAKSRGI